MGHYHHNRNKLIPNLTLGKIIAMVILFIIAYFLSNFLLNSGLFFAFSIFMGNGVLLAYWVIIALIELWIVYS